MNLNPWRSLRGCKGGLNRCLLAADWQSLPLCICFPLLFPAKMKIRPRQALFSLLLLCCCHGQGSIDCDEKGKSDVLYLLASLRAVNHARHLRGSDISREFLVVEAKAAIHESMLVSSSAVELVTPTKSFKYESHLHHRTSSSSAPCFLNTMEISRSGTGMNNSRTSQREQRHVLRIGIHNSDGQSRFGAESHHSYYIIGDHRHGPNSPQHFGVGGRYGQLLCGCDKEYMCGESRVCLRGGDRECAFGGVRRSKSRADSGCKHGTDTECMGGDDYQCLCGGDRECMCGGDQDFVHSASDGTWQDPPGFLQLGGRRCAGKAARQFVHAISGNKWESRSFQYSGKHWCVTSEGTLKDLNTDQCEHRQVIICQRCIHSLCYRGGSCLVYQNFDQGKYARICMKTVAKLLTTVLSCCMSGSAKSSHL